MSELTLLQELRQLHTEAHRDFQSHAPTCTVEAGPCTCGVSAANYQTVEAGKLLRRLLIQHDDELIGAMQRLADLKAHVTDELAAVQVRISADAPVGFYEYGLEVERDVLQKVLAVIESPVPPPADGGKA